MVNFLSASQKVPPIFLITGDVKFDNLVKLCLLDFSKKLLFFLFVIS